MSLFTEVMATNPPRLVVLFQRGPDGSEQFQWGVVGHIPVLSMIGQLIRVQADLVSGEWIPECESEPPGNHPPALVVVWDGADRTLSHYVHSDIPAVPLAGMLETVKAMLVDSRVAAQAGAQKTLLLGPDGTPMRY
jgi:hypothetical protein